MGREIAKIEGETREGKGRGKRQTMKMNELN